MTPGPAGAAGGGQDRAAPAAGGGEDQEVRALHEALLAAWNQSDAAAYAGLFAEDGSLVGFDGSAVDGRSAIGAHLGEIFADHQVARYVGKVREVRRLAPEVALLRAVVGMVPPGGSDINPEVNAVQSLVAVCRGGRWRAALLHTTPAALHRRADLREQLTEELRAVLHGR